MTSTYNSKYNCFDYVLFLIFFIYFTNTKNGHVIMTNLNIDLAVEYVKDLVNNNKCVTW